MAKAFVSRFITNSRRPREVDSLLFISMKDFEFLKNYTPRFWELYNEVDGCSEEIAVKTFKLSKLRTKTSPYQATNQKYAGYYILD
jgi:hypothetical protein